MDHPAELAQTDSWRRAALVAAGIAALELLLLVVIGLAVVAKPFLDRGDPREAAAKASTAQAAPRPAQAPRARLAREETSVVVLNGNGRPGAAGEVADLVRTRRYMIAATANAPRTDFARSIVMFRPGYRGEAERLARDFRIRRVAPLDGLTRADLQGAHVALVVGRA